MFAKLFPEILSHIMVLTQKSESVPCRIGSADEEYDSDTNLVPRQPFEIRISHVNSSIRSIALNTSRLWSAIHVDSGVQDANIILERITAYLTRSRGHLLDVRIELESSNLGDSSLSQAIGLIAQESRRWRKLMIVTEDEGITDVVAGVCDKLVGGGEEDLTPALEFLSVSVDYSEEGVANLRGVSGVSQRAGIETLSLQGQRLAPSHTTTSPAFRRLTIKQLPKLSFLRLRGLALYLFRPTLLPGLQTLHLDQTKAIPISFDFLNSLVTTCPMLECLSIYGDIIMSTGHRAYSVGAVQPALTPVLGGQSYPTGCSRIGTGPKGRVKQALDSAISLPELRSLRLCGITGSVFKIMLSRLVAPKLQSLSVKGVQEHDLDLLWENQSTCSSSHDHEKNQRHVASSVPSSSRFTQMRSLALSNSDLSLSLYQQLFQAFPRIVEFASHSSVQVHTIPKLLVEGEMGVPWPDLRTLNFAFDIDWCEGEEMLEVLMKQRGESGYPIDELHIGVDEVDLEETLETDGQTTVVMERRDWIGTWPSDRQYLDVDDILF